MANLTKRDLVMQISKDTGIIQQEVFAVLQQTLDLITEALASGRDVELRNFGVFEVRLTKARVGRNPKTGDKVEVPAKRVPYFKPSKELKSLPKLPHLVSSLVAANRFPGVHLPVVMVSQSNL